jgi:heme A synthase
MLKNQKVRKGKLNDIAQILDTEMGDALMDGLFGAALTFTPGIKEDARAQRLAKQFRVSAMSVAGNVVMGELLGTLVPALTTALNSLPEPKRELHVPEEILPDHKVKAAQEEKEVVSHKKSRTHG